MIFKSSHGDIFYNIYGPENSLVIAFVHGMLVDHKMFEKQISEFKDEYRVLVWDMPEHGQSVKRDKTFDFAIAAKCFVELLDELGIQKTVLAGVSMGGYVSQYIANKHPERIMGVAIEGSHPLHSKLSKPMHFGLMMGSFMFKYVPLSIFKNYSIKMTPGDEEKKYIEETFSQLDRKRAMHIYEGLRQQILKGIDKPVQLPVLITNGEKEASFIRNTCAQWHNSNPEIQYVVIPGAGHDAMFTNPAEYHKALRSFLAKLKY